MSYFSAIDPIRYEGSGSDNPLAFRWYDKDRVVLGKRMEDHLRLAVCYWHSFCWTGSDPFGGDTFERPWFQGGSPLEQAQRKAEAAFEFFSLLGAPYYCFHDRDVAPEGDSPRKSDSNFRHMVELLGRHTMRAVGIVGATGALLAQGLSPYDAGSVAAHLHGRAGTLSAGGASTTAHGVLDAWPDAVREAARLGA